MRTDVKRDMRQTRLPNASHLGFDLWVAKPGNWIVTDDHHYGRVLCGVTALSSDDKGTRYIEAAVFSRDHSFLMLRWYTPEQIAQCRADAPQATFALMCGDVASLGNQVRAST